MRSIRSLLALSVAGTLAACGGDTAPQTVGGVAPPSGSPTPTHSFVNPTEPKTYDGLGVVQHYQYTTQSDGAGQDSQLYAGDAGTVRDSGISLTYNPRDAIFELTISRPKGLVSVSAFRFQDPAHRTAFGGAAEPQPGVPNFAGRLDGIQYLEAGGSTGRLLDPASPYATSGLGVANSDYDVGADGFSSTRQTFFYQKPGTTTKYVTYAGFVRNTITASLVQQNDPNATPQIRESYNMDRAAFVFGERTANAGVPKSGTGTFDGDMLASIAFNPNLDVDVNAPTYLQWMSGSNHTVIDFAAGTVKTDLTGSVLAPALDAYTSGQYSLAAGSTFSAFADATIDIINKGGFTGTFGCAAFNGACTRGQAAPTGALNIAGSSLDGAFFGPNGEEIGGGFRIVGGTPDQRIDILGAYTGAKK